MTENQKFWIQIVVSLIPTIVSIIIAIREFGKRKDEEKKVEALNVLFGNIKGWREYIQSSANANTLLRNHIRGSDAEGNNVAKFSSLDDVEAAVDTNGAYLNGLHVGIQKELEGIENKLNSK
jgi:hypothetical protein